MKTRVISVLGSLCVLASATLVAKELTVVSWGAVNQQTHAKVYARPFEKATGTTVRSETYRGEMDEIRNMVKAGRVGWDVVEVETPDLLKGCQDGLFEKLDRSRIPALSDLIPGAVTECGVGSYVWSMVITWNPAKVKRVPASWTQFWDVKGYPGKRGLLRTAKYTLEIALLADGVAPADIYKLLSTQEGVDRAFRKLDEIKPNIRWWDAAAQVPVWLRSGDLDISAGYSFWIDAAQRQGLNLRMTWGENLYQIDHWAIVKGAPNIDDAYRFIAFASAPQNQKRFSDDQGYGPANKKAIAMLNAKRVNQVPRWGANLKNGLAIDESFWIAHGEELEKRFRAWAPEEGRPLQEVDDDAPEEPPSLPIK